MSGDVSVMIDRAGFAATSMLVMAACNSPLPACAPGQLPVGGRVPADPIAGYRVRAHSHNDFQHAGPLADALDAGFTSVEADIYFGDGRLPVSHDGDGSKGTLQDLYLDPLAAAVAAHHGSVYGDGVAFRLVIDLKESSNQLAVALNDLLQRYSILTVFGDQAVIPGPVTIVLTGDEALKRSFVDRFTPRLAVRDSNDFSWDDPPSDGRWTDYALAWSTYLEWDGSGAIPEHERDQLSCLADTAHALDRRLRIYDAPDRDAAWAAQLDAGVDFIGSDDLAGLSQFLATR